MTAYAMLIRGSFILPCTREERTGMLVVPRGWTTREERERQSAWLNLDGRIVIDDSRLDRILFLEFLI